MASKKYHVYILECSDGTYYTGIALDVNKRLECHNSGKGAKYTRGRIPVKLRYSEKLKSYKKACQREVEIKRWPREKKEQLIISK
jgi:putative endonuclease